MNLELRFVDVSITITSHILRSAAKSSIVDDVTRNTDFTEPDVDTNSKTGSDERCMPCGHNLNARNLVVCIDGSSNKFGDKVSVIWRISLQHPDAFNNQNTNVIELYNLVMKKDEDNQKTWYNSGIGTYAESSWKSLGYYKKVLYHKIDLAIAWWVIALLSHCILIVSLDHSGISNERF